MIKVYMHLNRWIWNCLNAVQRGYGRHVHRVVRTYAERGQNHSTLFLRNRAELELVGLLLDQKAHGSNLNIAVLACSTGAETYSFLWTIRSKRPDLKPNAYAVDISQEIVEFARKGVYSRYSRDVWKLPNGTMTCDVFDRMTDAEIAAMFEVEGDQAKVRSWIKEGITWLCGDVGGPEIIGVLGPQDIVVANRFLCHMTPPNAERCLRNIARLVKPGGYLFVSGVYLELRTKVAVEAGWKPVPALMREIHEGDAPSLRDAWPLGYWGLEPFREDRADWRIRYTSVFQIGENLSSDKQSDGQHDSQSGPGEGRPLFPPPSLSAFIPPLRPSVAVNAENP